MKATQIQIDKDLFLRCYLLLADEYFINNTDEDTYTNLLKSVQKPLKAKYEAIHKRELYTKSKTGETTEAREQARQAYLDLIGMKKDWRFN